MKAHNADAAIRWLPLTVILALALQVAVLWFDRLSDAETSWLPGLAEASLVVNLLLAALATLALRRARERIRAANRSLEEAIDALPASVEIFDQDDRLVAYNKQLAANYPHMVQAFQRGDSFEALVRRSVREGAIPAAVGREEAWLAERFADRARGQEALLQRLSDGRWLRIFERRTPSGGTVGVRLDVSDLILEQQRLAASQAHLKAFVQAAPNGVLTLDTEGHVLELNPAAERLFGFRAAELRGSHIDLLFGICMGESPAELLGESRELSTRRRDGQELTLQLNMAEVRTDTTHRFVCIITDLTERKRQEVALQLANAQLARQSTTDGLTGVGNRRHFDHLLQQEWLNSASQGRSLACLMVDIDHFKQYNDHYGHIAGDETLRRVAELLHTCVGRGGGSVCRFGGEEFVLLLPDTDVAEAQTLAQRCLDSLRLAAIEHAASPLRRSLSLSIGVAACVAEAHASPLRLVEQADAALYAAKQNGRARLVSAPLNRAA
jgi:diguanylate cyclase (GGDEF)-like protein/PAS domain S-box-containing protein